MHHKGHLVIDARSDQAYLDSIRSIGGSVRILVPGDHLPWCKSVGGDVSIFAPGDHLPRCKSVGRGVRIYAAGNHLPVCTRVGGRSVADQATSAMRACFASPTWFWRTQTCWTCVIGTASAAPGTASPDGHRPSPSRTACRAFGSTHLKPCVTATYCWASSTAGSSSWTMMRLWPRCARTAMRCGGRNDKDAPSLAVCCRGRRLRLRQRPRLRRRLRPRHRRRSIHERRYT